MLWILLLIVPVPLHREYRGMDDGGNRPAAVAGLRPDAHGRRLFEDGLGRQRAGSRFLGFMGMYTVLSILFLFLVRREIEHGPEPG